MTTAEKPSVKTLGGDIGMEFGIDKRAKATFKGGKLTKIPDLDFDSNKRLRN